MEQNSRRHLRQSVVDLLGRLQVNENTLLGILAGCVGIAAGFANYGFRWIIDVIHHLVVEQGMDWFGISMHHWSWSRLWIVLFPAVGGLLLIPFGLWFAKDLKWGFSAFLERVNLRGAKVPGRTIFTRGMACAITLGTGGSAGQEGPIAQIGGAIGSSLGQVFRVSGGRLKTLVACGVAGGVAATFNAPIAGVFFAQEIVLLSTFELASFTPIVIAAGLATVVSRILLGNTAEFLVLNYSLNSHWELVFYCLMGILIGVLASIFVGVHSRIKDQIQSLPIHPLLKPVVGGFAVGAIAIAFPQVLGNGYHFMQSMLDGQGPFLLLAALVVFKVLATSITLGSGLPGGMFAPSLYLGAAIGGAFGHLLEMLFPTMAIFPGQYALVGMGAFLAAATHAPMTAIFLLFEMTASYHVIIPIMITCVLGTAIARNLRSENLETVELAKAGINLHAGKERSILQGIRVEEVMVRHPETVPENMTLGQFADFLGKSKHTNFPLMNPDGKMSGFISVQDFMGVAFERDLMDLVVVKELATADVVTVSPSDNLDEAMQRMGHRNIEQLAVVDPMDATRLVGMISRRDMISAYNRALLGRTLEEQVDG